MSDWSVSVTDCQGMVAFPSTMTAVLGANLCQRGILCPRELAAASYGAMPANVAGRHHGGSASSVLKLWIKFHRLNNGSR